TWTYLAATYNAVTGQSLYVNGVQVAHVSTTGSMVTSGGPLRIGGNSIWGEYFTGRIDEVRVYNRALSQTEIQADMGSPIVTTTPTPTPTPQPTETPTPTPTPAVVSVSGIVVYCTNPSPGPVPNVTLTLTGSGSGSTLSDGSGNYQFSALPAGGNYTVTPSKAARLPGSANINTVDVIGVQKQFLTGTFLTGCRLMAADVNGDTLVNTQDVIAVQRFFSGFTNAIANVGKYKFTPANRTYAGITTNQTAQ